MCGATGAAIFVLLFLLLTYVTNSPIQPHSKGVFVSDLIRYSESIQYDPVPLEAYAGSGARRRRHTTKHTAKPLIITFNALDRLFTLVLHEDASVFTADAVFETPSGHVDFDTDRVYTGHLQDEPNSHVQGLVTSDGRFDGTIESRGEVFYVEPASRYGKQQANVHTIIYRSSDVRKHIGASLPCASQLLYERRNRRSSNSDLVTELTESSVLKTYLYGPDGAGSGTRRRHNITLKPTAKPALLNSLNKPRILSTIASDSELLPNGTLRHVNKRATVDPNKTTCMLYLQADHLFYQKYGTEEACIEVMTRHVQRVNAIYRNTDFNMDGVIDKIGFMIKRIKVHTLDGSNEPGYRFPGNYGVEKFLELFSEEDYDAFCLAYMFTYRDFEMGTLGLAWTGDLKNAGGVCEKNGHYRGSLKSLNTGIVTLLNYGKHVPPAVSHVTLAHEIGHNFGSPHDPEMCTPGGEDGNFIMFARATSGDKKNNNKFSPCSLNSINPVLNTKARSHMGCFTEAQLAICGNGVVEAGEECDCGWEEDCRDACCYPQRRYPPNGEPPCTLTPNSVCSPSQGPCCTNECHLRFGDKCRDDNGCRDSSYCDGRAPACPPSINKPNKTICNEEFVCFIGECTGSICLAYGLESCQCIPGPEELPTKACELCCKKPGDDEPCLSSFAWNDAPFDVPNMYSKPGTPCNDYNGYCDVFQRCREVDPSGPLATLRKLLLSDENIASVKKWVQEHWYAVLVIVTTFIVLLMLSIRLLGRRLDSKLKSITIIHSATTETVRLPPDNDQSVTVHPSAVRSKLPLHRKVREKKLHSKVANRRKKKPKPEGSEGINKSASDTKKVSKSPKKTVRREEKSTEAKVRTKSRREKPPPTSSTSPPTPASPIYENLLAKLEDAKPGKLMTTRLKRSNRVSTEISAEKPDDKLRKIASPAKKRKRTKVHGATKVELPVDDPVGKVHNWLLQSISSGTVLPKSKSSPMELSKPVQQRVVQIPKLTQPRSRSAGNLRKEAKKEDKMKLQVLYRPPFKFSLKLRNGVGSVRTKVLNSPVGTSPRDPVSHSRDPVTRGPRPALLLTSQDDIDSNVHTVPSDLDVLLSESEFLFSDA